MKSKRVDLDVEVSKNGTKKRGGEEDWRARNHKVLSEQEGITKKLVDDGYKRVVGDTVFPELQRNVVSHHCIFTLLCFP